MDNSFVNDKQEYYDNPYTSTKKNKVGNKYTVMITTIIIIIIIVFVVVKLLPRDNGLNEIENNLIKGATEYLNKTGIPDKEIYIDTTKMNIDIPSNCNVLSGVFYNNGEYKPYLLCNDYESKINESSVLKGKNIILLTKGSNYYELGYNSQNNYQISGTVNTNIEGVYNIYYIPSNSSNYEIRKVVVIDNPSANSYIPEITYTDNIELMVGQQYESNLKAYDKTDGDITSKVIIKDNTNINEIGEYKNIYSVTNSLGYTKMSTQNITVFNEIEMSILTELSDDNMTNKSVSILVKVKGDRFNNLILPDGTETKDKEYLYEVEENGEYEFIAVDKSGNKVTKKIKVNNIDKTIPTGTCKAISYNDKTVFNVNITSFNNIVGYNYYIDANGSGYLTSSTHTTVKTTSTNLSVTVKDYIGNESTIKCMVEDKKTYFDPRGYRVVIRDKPRLHIAIGDALAKKGYTVNDLNKCIFKRVQDAGPYTRWGVTAAAYGLIDCTYSMTGYVLPYNHSGGKVMEERTASGGSTSYCSGINSDICGKLGVNRNWGKPGGTCSSSNCWYGLNCATFVRWAMCNGGMDLCSKGSAGAHDMTSVKYFPEADGVDIKQGKVTYYSGRNLTGYSAEQLVRMIKPGDIIATGEGGGHTFVVVGIDNNGIYTAEDGYFMRNLSYKHIINNTDGFRILYLDKYYDNPKNRNNLYG